MRSEEANAAGADAQRSWGEAGDVGAVQAVALQLLCREALGGGGVARREAADCSDRGGVRPFALATEVERREHGWTQGAHRLSPFVSRVVDGRRKTS